MTAPLESPSLLLVEDSPDDVLFFHRAARRCGISEFLRVASDGDEAVAYLEGRGKFGDRAAHPFPALVVLDLKLPRRSGLEVLAWLRSEPRFRSLPVIILTSSKEPADLARAHELGVTAYHSKPVDFRELTVLVQSIGEFWKGLVLKGPRERAG